MKNIREGALRSYPSMTYTPDDVKWIQRHVGYSNWLNSTLRFKSWPLSRAQQTAAAQMDSLFRRAPLTTHELTVFRAVSTGAIEHMDISQPGDTFIDDGFVATCPTIQGARHDGYIHVNDRVILIIRIPVGMPIVLPYDVLSKGEGADARAVHLASWEQEMILPRGCKFTVKKIAPDGRKIWLDASYKSTLQEATSVRVPMDQDKKLTNSGSKLYHFTSFSGALKILQSGKIFTRGFGVSFTRNPLFAYQSTVGLGGVGVLLEFDRNILAQEANLTDFKDDDYYGDEQEVRAYALDNSHRLSIKGLCGIRVYETYKDKIKGATFEEWLQQLESLTSVPIEVIEEPKWDDLETTIKKYGKKNVNESTEQYQIARLNVIDYKRELLKPYTDLMKLIDDEDNLENYRLEKHIMRVFGCLDMLLTFGPGYQRAKEIVLRKGPSLSRFVVKHDGKIVGAILLDEDAKEVEVKAIVAHPKVQLRMPGYELKGVGTFLMKFAFKYGEVRGKKVRVHADLGASGFYEKIGMKKVAPSEFINEDQETPESVKKWFRRMVALKQQYREEQLKPMRDAEKQAIRELGANATPETVSNRIAEILGTSNLGASLYNAEQNADYDPGYEVAKYGRTLNDIRRDDEFKQWAKSKGITIPPFPSDAYVD